MSRPILKEKLIAAIEQAPKGPDRNAADIARYLSDAYLDNLIASAVEKYAPLEPAPPFSDEALALQFAVRHVDRLRYVAKWGSWFIWDGTCRSWRENEWKRRWKKG